MLKTDDVTDQLEFALYADTYIGTRCYWGAPHLQIILACTRTTAYQD